MTTGQAAGEVAEDAAKGGRRSSLIASVATVGSYTMISRVLGFLRDMMMAALLGAGPIADAFVVAFKLPNFLRRLFAEGAFNAGFVPMFARTLEGEGKDVARDFAAQAQAVLLAVLLPLFVVGLIAMPWIIGLMAAGFEPGGARFEAAVDLSRITFCYIVFISLVALYSGILNSLGHFAVPAAAPIILNFCLLAAMLLSYLWLDAPGEALAWGVAIAGLGQMLWVRAAAARRGMAPPLQRPRFSPEVKRLFALILPGVFGAGVAQISLFADVIFASFLKTGSVSYLYYADRVSQLPLGVIGVAIGTALLPLMSRQLRAGETAAAVHSQNRGIELALLLTVPAAIGIAVLSLPIVTVLFERGEFGRIESVATAAALSAYALGLPAYVLIKVLAPGFFAREDTKTPVKIAVICLIANVVFVLALIGPLQHVGIALGTVLSSWLNAILLCVMLRRQGLFHLDERSILRLPRIVLAGVIMALVVWQAMRYAALLLPGLLALVVTIGLGGLTFFAAASWLRAFDLQEVKALLRKRA
ncbi:MAG: murein biosynthesis integral membrane protein MurJ [Alphaproteobacteria bacterium]